MIHRFARPVYLLVLCVALVFGSTTVLPEPLGCPDIDGDGAFVGRALYNLGEALTDLGRYDDAEPLLRRSLGIMHATFGEEHTTVATALYGLAELHAARGELDRAESLHTQALVMREKLLGVDHSRVATSRKALAAVLRRAGRMEEAAARAPDGEPD